MNILIVGAGAVGQVYGYHFSQHGHRVTYLIKEKYQPTLASGLCLYYLNKDKHLKKPIVFNEFDTISHWPEFAQHSFDLIILTIPSHALRQLPFAEIVASTQNTVPLLMLQASAEDKALLQQKMPQQALAEGMITLIAYQTQLPGQTADKDGIAYYLPPMAMPISAADNHLATHIKNIFNNSDIKARCSQSALDDAKLPSAFLMTFLCCLEAADWNFQQLKQSPLLLQQLATAQRYLLPQRVTSATAEKLLKRLAPIMLKPWFYRLLLTLAPYAVPLPLEPYLKFHFSKVRAQTLLYMHDYMAQYPDPCLRVLVDTISDKEQPC